ncbi:MULTISPECIES: endo-1,4-beta-xylanase [unclassified Leifsonia]|uniref:endo-1,4-beta-xylanase n=1 Tax=unclassified Leifsonia TaxID=2663824 RepID=UPI0006F497FE|nr:MULTISPECIES: endo-1,4-beta-xylanase [unclassified Leifsonia]KQX05618.1 1,4-beta-xylanase [Leifsonia sp. Root1293]KRA09252.1 1,4-beta-xylanase [Leifsonia sp. Root60]
MDVVSPGRGGPPQRLGEAVVTVRDQSGRPLQDSDVLVQQTAHAFAFGNIGFDFIDHANGSGSPGDADLAALWLDLFNTATLPFYWGGFEPHRGRPDTARLRTTARWFADRGVALKGHPLVWHTVQPSWLLEHDVDGIERLQRERIRREVGDFAGLIDTWDAINEVVIMPVFDKEDNGITRLARARGRIAMVRLAYEEALATNPAATLLINDFDLSSAYECLLEGLLEAGIPISAIGLQTHMHQGYWGEEAMLAMVDRFARYGLPLHLTETSLVSGELMPGHIVDLNDYQVPSWPSTPDGEARQADELVRHYRSLVGHPSVAAITYWGITDRDAWLGAPIGLVRADGSRKPAYDALHALVKGEWWLQQTTARTDHAGRFRLQGFAGDYGIAPARGSGIADTVRLEAGPASSATATVTVTA